MPAPDPAEIEALRASLTRTPPREIPTRYLYDDRGSELFEEITRLEEYYPTRTEEGILERNADAIVARVAPRELAELGSGAGRKIRFLLDAMGRAGGPRRCRLLDINASFLEASAARLRAEYPDLEVHGVVGDFLEDLDRLGPGGERLVLFLASTIGNLRDAQAVRLLGAVRAQMAPDDGFLVGFDLVKDVGRLVRAYDDAQGVTAAFNRNTLRVLDRRFDADFDPDGFDHVALWDAERSRIEMRLRARRAMRVRVGALDLTLDLAAGEEIRTEISSKYTRPRIEGLAAAGGFRVAGWWTDEEGLFADVLLVPAAA